MIPRKSLFILSSLFFIFILFTNLSFCEAEIPLAASLTVSSAEQVSLSFNLDNLQIEERTITGTSCDCFTVEGEGMIREEGKPILPAVSRFVIVPPDAGLELVINDIETSEVRTANQALPLYNTDGTIKALNMVSQGIFPPEIAKISDPVVIRGVRMVLLTVYPVQYNSDNNSYIHNSHIEASIRFTDEEPVNPARRTVRNNRSPHFLKFIKSLAVNGDMAGRDDPGRDFQDETPGHYLIVAHENCVEHAAPFIEWRRKCGYKVDIISIDNDISQQPENIKGIIQDLYDDYLDAGIDPFDNILLIGDVVNYPYGPQPGWILDSFEGESVWANPEHADYLYACLEGNDDFPDVAFGRWPSGSEAMMALAVGRTLGYEMTPSMENPEWFDRTGVFFATLG